MADMTPTTAFGHAPTSAAKTTFITAVDTLMTAINTIATTAATGTAQVWTVAISGTPTGGTYDITIDGDTDIAAQTITVAYNASAATIQTALRALTGTGLDQTTVTATGSTPDFTNTITFKGTREDITVTVDVTDMTGGVTVGTPTETVAYASSQAWTVAISGTPTGGTYDITIVGDGSIAEQTVTVAYNASAATIQTALRALTGTGLAATTVSASGSTPNFTHTITFINTREDITVTVDVAAATGGTPVGTPTETVAYADSQAWTVAISGTPAAGTYDITILGDDSIAEQTISVVYNASAATIQTALRALTGTGLSATTVSASGSTPNFTHTITFINTREDITVTVDVAAATDTVGTRNETTAFIPRPYFSTRSRDMARQGLVDWCEAMASNMRV